MPANLEVEPNRIERKTMDSKEMIGLLNEALAQEHACIFRYLTHAAVVKGVFHENNWSQG